MMDADLKRMEGARDEMDEQERVSGSAVEARGRVRKMRGGG